MTNTLVKTRDKASKKQAIAPQSQPIQPASNRYRKRIDKKIAARTEEISLNLSSSISMAIPKFCKHQIVHFIGGTGTIKGRRASAGAWLYTIEMAQGPEPEMGGIGSETIILLYEADLQS
ncbi:hypothetical protein [Scytonema millei]|nr:hypothetical protein [Scytonema millei]